MGGNRGEPQSTVREREGGGGGGGGGGGARLRTWSSKYSQPMYKATCLGPCLTMGLEIPLVIIVIMVKKMHVSAHSSESHCKWPISLSHCCTRKSHCKSLFIHAFIKISEYTATELVYYNMHFPYRRRN